MNKWNRYSMPDKLEDWEKKILRDQVNKCIYCHGLVGMRHGKPNKSCAKQECRGKAKAIGGRKAAKNPKTRIKGSKFL